MNSKSDKTNSSSSQLSNIQKVFYGGLLLGIFFFAGNGVIGLTHPDEVFYTQTAVEMLQHKTWLTPYLFDGPNFEKPIVTYWLLMIAFKVFGVTAFGARFFPAVFASIGIIGIYFLGKIAFRDEKKALCGALVMMSSALYFGLARTVFTDMFFTVFIELALVSFYWGYSVAKRKSLGTILFWVFAALAALSKGILGLAIPFAVMFVFLVLRKELKFIFNRVFVIGFLLFLLIALPWYLFMIKTFGQSFISEFFYNDHVRRLLEAEHGSNDKWFFYPLSMVALMMPWSLFLVAAAGGFFKRVWEKSSPIYLFLLCWLAVTFTVFQIAHSKLVSYILPLFPVLAIITGDKVAEMIEKQKDKKFFIISALLLPIVVFVGSIVGFIHYSKYIPATSFVFSLLAGYFGVLIISAVLIWKRDNPSTRMGMVMIQIPLLLIVALSAHRLYEDYATSQNACRYLSREYKGDAPIVSSRMFIRAVRFFTQKNVVFVNFSGRQFFSPHPVAELNDIQGVAAFVRAHPLVYGVLKKHEVQDLQNATAQPYSVEVLSVFGDQFVVKMALK